jgi:hypothetical protein
MLDADSRQVGNFVFRKNLLSGFNCDHPVQSSGKCSSPQHWPELESGTLRRVFHKQ